MWGQKHACACCLPVDQEVMRSIVQQRFEENRTNPESPVKLNMYLGHSMTQQVDKRCLHYQVLGLMVVLAVFSGLGDTKEKSEDVILYNTTHSNGSGEEPRVLAIQRPCGPEHEGFCLNGACSYSSELDTPICRCDKLYSGMRCENAVLDAQQSSSPEEVIGISCGIFLFLGIIFGLMYCCLKKRCRKSSPPYKNYGSENSV